MPCSSKAQARRGPKPIESPPGRHWCSIKRHHAYFADFTPSGLATNRCRIHFNEYVAKRRGGEANVRKRRAPSPQVFHHASYEPVDEISPHSKLQRLMATYPEMHDSVACGLGFGFRYSQGKHDPIREMLGMTIVVERLAREGITDVTEIREFLRHTCKTTMRRSPRIVRAGYLADERDLDDRVAAFLRIRPRLSTTGVSSQPLGFLDPESRDHPANAGTRHELAVSSQLAIPI